MSDKRRDLTEEESESVPSYFNNPFYSLEDNLVYATWNGRVVSSLNAKFPWTFVDKQRQVHFDDYKESFLNIERVFDLEYTGLTGQYRSKSVGWSNAQQRWIYRNNRVVVFTDSEKEASDPETPQDDLGSDDEQEEVSQLLESVTQSITAVVGQLSCPQTPVTVPGALPSTPVSPLRVQLPTPQATAFQGYASGSHSLTWVPVPQSPLSPYTRVTPSSPLVPPRVPLPQAPVPPLRVFPAPVIAPVGMANPPSTKLLGAAPEPFDGKPEKAKAFWNNLENYFHLNILSFDTDDKKISTALTYFKVGTPAGQWAQDKQKAALNPVGGGTITFGAWNDFKMTFQEHF